MKFDHDTLVGRFVAAAVAFAIRRVIVTLGWTWRVRVVEGASLVQSLSRTGKPVLISFWHNRIVSATPFLLKHFHRNGLPLAVLTSASRDGELVARAVSGWGVPAVRGSSSRGGRAAVRGTLRMVRRHRASPVVIPDGPGGPPYRFKEGVVHLARLSDVPIVLIGVAADRYWTIGSWDRLMIPRPYARVSIVIRSPRPIASTLSDEAAEQERVRQESSLNDATLAAERATGVPGSLPIPTPADPHGSEPGPGPA